MASPYQQQALQRKFIYCGVIIALFTAALLFRNLVIKSQAKELALNEETVGDVELSGSAIRLLLTGSRGLAVCFLWNSAIDRQKKNQWDELEILVNSVTKLQPHFITPWLFQSWNLSYNVAVKCDVPRDKYFYIARGCDLLAEGERQNRFQPDLRFAMGTYYHQKISMADLKEPLQALFEMSGIDPVHRDPTWLRALDKDGRPRFETFFCERHPRLARRLREKLSCLTQEQALKFLEENNKIPSLYNDKRFEGEGDARQTPMKLNREKPFPLLPQRDYDPNKVPSLVEMGPDSEAFAAARTWYVYAQEPLPDPEPDAPGVCKPIEDRIHQRVPQHMTTVIFRNYPARAQSYIAERLEEEGWFDDSGWKITGWFGPSDKFSNGETAITGTGRSWAHDAWKLAHEEWSRHGERNSLIWSPEKLADLKQQADKFMKARGLQPGMAPPPLRVAERNDPDMVKAAQAFEKLFLYEHARGLTNFDHFYFRSLVEQEPETIALRKLFFEAEQLRLAGKAQALPKYEEALVKWKEILLAHPDFRNDAGIAEDSYEVQLNYLQLFGGTPTGRLLKQQVVAQAVLGQALSGSFGPECLSLVRLSRPQSVSLPVMGGPLDGDDGAGHPLIDDDFKLNVIRRKGLLNNMRAGPPPGAMQPGRGSLPPGMGPGGGMPLPGQGAKGPGQ